MDIVTDEGMGGEKLVGLSSSLRGEECIEN